MIWGWGWGKARPEQFCSGVLQYVGNVVAHPGEFFRSRPAVSA